MLSNIFGKKKNKPIFNLTPEQDSFLSEASDEYNIKLSEMVKKYKITDLNWGYDQETLKLSLLDDDNKTIYEGDAQIVGSFYKPDGTWEWAWNNPNIEKQATKESLLVKNYGKKEGLEYLTNGVVNILGNEVFAAYLSAIGLKVCNADYPYRGDTGELVVYLLVSNMQTKG